MQHPATALMAHYRMTSKYAYTLDKTRVTEDLLSVVDPEFRPDVMALVKANLRSNYDVTDGDSARQAVQMLREAATTGDALADENADFARRYPQLLALAGSAETAGFQYSRAVEIISRAVCCAYLTPEEAGGLLDGIAAEVRARFADWPQFVASCMLGKLLMTHHFDPQSDMVLSVEDYVKDMLLLLLSPARPLHCLGILPPGDGLAVQAALQALLPEPFDLQTFKDTTPVSAETAYEVLVWPAVQQYGIDQLLADDPAYRFRYVTDDASWFYRMLNDAPLFVSSTEQHPDELPLLVFDSKKILTTRGVYYRKDRMMFWGKQFFTAWEDGVRFEVKVSWTRSWLDVYVNGIKICGNALRKRKFADDDAEKAFLEHARKTLEDFLNSFAHSGDVQWR